MSAARRMGRSKIPEAFTYKAEHMLEQAYVACEGKCSIMKSVFRR